jgi:hypothetical protein
MTEKRRLGEANEIILINRKLLGWLIFLGILLFLAKDPLINFIAFKGGHEVTGSLTGAEETNFSINEETVWRYFYSYTSTNGLEYKGFSYTTKDVAEKPTVLVSPFNPALSKIKGTQYAYIGGVGFWVLVVPIILILCGLLRAVQVTLRARALLIKGVFVDAEMVDSKEWGKVNDEPRFKVTYKATLPDGSTRDVVNGSAAPGFPTTARVLCHPTRNVAMLFDKIA